MNPNYRIYTCPKRKWYVDEFLIPSMLEQGIPEEKIFVYNDEEGKGVLYSFIQGLKDSTEDSWHLQDDILLSSKFRKKTTMDYPLHVVCGFSNIYSKDRPAGIVLPNDIWYSSQCIYIHPWICEEFVKWIDTYAINQKRYAKMFELGICDDQLFEEYLNIKEPSVKILNEAPNFVEHIDYLLGGSIVNPDAKANRRSIHWIEPELTQKLEKKLKERK